MASSFQLISLNCRYSHSCLALFYVRAALQSHLPGCRTTLAHFTINDPCYETLLQISGSSGDALFFSVYIWNGLYVSRLVTDLARVRPDLPVILGGPQALELEGLPENCTVVEGPVEGVGEEFYADLASGSLKARYWAEAGHPFPCPYRDEDFSGELLNRQVYYESSRGCPFHCSYCLSSIDRRVVHKDLEQVREELGRILAHDPMIIKFVDRTFNDHPDRALAIWRFLAGQKGRTRFHFEVAPDRFTEEMFAFLETVPPGRFQFEIGVQSTSPQTLAAIDRSMDVDRAAANIARLAGFDTIHLHVDLILGLPEETEESFRRSFNRVFALQSHYIQMGLLKVLPGTAMRRDAEAFGLAYCGQPPYQALANRWLDHLSLSRLYGFGECVEDFYNNRCFRSTWPYLLKKGEDPFHFFMRLRGIMQRAHYRGRSPTQEMLARVFCEMADERPDRKILRDLLRFDWLRCGHRFLPDFLDPESLRKIRSELWAALPQDLDGLYTHQTRSAFFKRVTFLKMSDEALREVGLDAEGKRVVVCLLPEQTRGVIRHNRAVIVEVG